MIAEQLIETARALAQKFPDQKQSIEMLIEAVERIDREFDGDERIELLGEASDTLERHMERARASAATKQALAELRESFAALEDAMKRLSTASKGALRVKQAEQLAAAWPRSPLPKKVTWH